MAVVALTRLDLLDEETPVLLGGGVLAARHPLLDDRIRALLAERAPKAVPRVVTARPVLGAALLGLDRVGRRREAHARAARVLRGERVRHAHAGAGTGRGVPARHGRRVRAVTLPEEGCRGGRRDGGRTATQGPARRTGTARHRQHRHRRTSAVRPRPSARPAAAPAHTRAPHSTTQGTGSDVGACSWAGRDALPAIGTQSDQDRAKAGADVGPGGDTCRGG